MISFRSAANPCHDGWSCRGLHHYSAKLLRLALLLPPRTLASSRSGRSLGRSIRFRLAVPDQTGWAKRAWRTAYYQWHGVQLRLPYPFAQPLIEIWQANKAGLYDTDKPGNFTEHVDFHLRGMMLTDQQGNYEFETIMPGRYPIPPNLPGLEKYAGLTRPAHIHFRVSESLHIPLTTQLYFKDDPHIAEDPWASRKSSLAIGLKQDGELLHGVFDLVLARGF